MCALVEILQSVFSACFHTFLQGSFLRLQAHMIALGLIMGILYMHRIHTSNTSSKCICRPILNWIVDLYDWAVWGKPCVIALIDFVSTENAGPTKWQQLCDSTSVCTMPRSSPMLGLSTEISSFPTGPIPQITSSGTPPSLAGVGLQYRQICIPFSGLSMFDCYSCFCLSLILYSLSVCGYKQSHQILSCIHKPSFSELCVETCPYNVHMYRCVCFLPELKSHIAVEGTSLHGLNTTVVMRGVPLIKTSLFLDTCVCSCGSRYLY